MGRKLYVENMELVDDCIGSTSLQIEEHLLYFLNEIAKISNEKASIRNCLKIKVLTDVISSIYLIMGLKKGQ